LLDSETERFFSTDDIGTGTAIFSDEESVNGLHIGHKGAEISRPVMRRFLKYPPVPPHRGHCDIRIPIENI
jgi:hypothetical protein